MGCPFFGRAGQGATRPGAQVMGWISAYQETLGDLGLEEEVARFPQGGSRGTTLLIDKYIERMRATLHAWFVNILEVGSGATCGPLPNMHLCHSSPSARAAAQADINSAPKQADDGRLWTPGAVDFFRIVNEQVAVVEEVSSADMLLRTGEAILHIMRDFQARSSLPRLKRGVHRRARPSRSWAVSPGGAAAPPRARPERRPALRHDQQQLPLLQRVHRVCRAPGRRAGRASQGAPTAPAARTLCRAPRAPAAAAG